MVDGRKSQQNHIHYDNINHRRTSHNMNHQTTSRQHRSNKRSSRSMIRIAVVVLSTIYLIHMLLLMLVRHQQSIDKDESLVSTPALMVDKKDYSTQNQKHHHPYIGASFTESRPAKQTKSSDNTTKHGREGSLKDATAGGEPDAPKKKDTPKPPTIPSRKESPVIIPKSTPTAPKFSPVAPSSTANDVLAQPQSPDVWDIVFPSISNNSTLPSAAEQRQVRDYLQRTLQRYFLPLAAVLETPPTITTSQKPLPIRSSSTLTKVSYPYHIQSCQDIPNHWPVHHTQDMDSKYGPNFGNLESLYRLRFDYANTTCPVDADPFLPWIHDVFVDATATSLEFVAPNKRRCRRDPRYYSKDIVNLESQVALMQSIPIQQLDHRTENNNHTTIVQDWNHIQSTLPDAWKDYPRSPKEHWYRLVPISDADIPETRFLCQFHTLRPTMDGIEKVIVQETWSKYPYNYEHASYQHRRGQMANPMLTRPLTKEHVDGIHNEQIWNSMLHVSCPIPQEISFSLKEKNTDGHIPSYYVDLVPVRTPPRENVTGYARPILHVSEFDPILEWGEAHVLPPVGQSGRWANIPICPSPLQQSTTKKKESESRKTATIAATTSLSTKMTTSSSNMTKPYFMVGCLWASAVFSERGSDTWDTHTMERLLEWLTYHLEIAGFDHMVVYDNTGAHTNATSLQVITAMFPSEKVTRIPWKHRVCNNNPYNHPNAGERSSQYAAEASCRIRYGPSTEWMAFFDTDEYLIPSGNWSSIREWLQVGVQEGSIGKDTHILSFYETKASLNHRFTEPFVNDSVEGCQSNCTDCDCRQKRSNATYLESFCEPHPFPREFPKTKAKMKQIYRPAFVLQHFVHYSTVTNFVHTRPKHPRVVGYPYERRAKEFTEAYMLHTKTRLPPTTSGWKAATSRCRYLPHKCPLGLPYPFYQSTNITNLTTTTITTDIGTSSGNDTKYRTDQSGRLIDSKVGLPCNCWELEKIQEDLAGRLHTVLDPIKAKWRASF